MAGTMNRPELLFAIILCSACVSKRDLPPPDSGEAETSVCSPPEVQCGDFCIDPSGDPHNCGGCGNTCTALQTCESGLCTCLEGYEDCGGVCVNVMVDRRHCGECGNQCDPLAACQSGVCVCPADLTDCDGQCVDTSTDAENCGGCGFACSGIEFCNGSGRCALECESPYTLCNPGTNAYCADLQSDPDNCYECRIECPERDHSVPVCEGGVCTIACDFGYGNADGSEENGCECTITSLEELCDNVDNDCNGSTDETFTCALGSEEECILVAACSGRQRCVPPDCTWGTCVNSVWECTHPATDTRPCGNCGIQTCTDTCIWGTCVEDPPCP